MRSIDKIHSDLATAPACSFFPKHPCNPCHPWLKNVKDFENFVPQFPKKEVKGCFRQLNMHYLGKSVQSVVLCSFSQLEFI
jgi:hypothetical protein